MSNNLSLKVTADIADAQAKLSILNAEFKATQTQINSLARAGAAGNLSSAGATELQALTTRSLELQAAAKPLAATIAEAGFAVKGLGAAASTAGRSAEEMGINMSSATRFSRELFDEFSSGRTRYIPSTLAELAQQGFHLSPAMLAGYGGVAILAAGLGYLAYRSMKAEEALQGIADSAVFLGNVNVTSNFAGQLVAQIQQATDVSTAEAQKTAQAITSIQNLSSASMSAVAGNIGVVAQAFNTTTDQAAATVGKILDVNTSVQKLQELLPGLSAAQVQQAQTSQESGDYAVILTERWRLLTSQLQRMQQEQLKAAQQQLDLARSAEGMKTEVARNPYTQDTAEIHQLEEVRAQITRNIELTKQMAAQPIGPQAAQNQLKAALDAAAQLDTKDTERKQILGEIGLMEQAILTANKQQRVELEAGIAAAHERLQALQGSGGVNLNSWQASLSSETDNKVLEQQQEIANQLPGLMQQAQDKQNEIEQQGAEAAQEILRMRVEYARNALTAEVDAGKVSVAQRAAVEHQLTEALYAEDLKRLENEQSTLAEDPAAYARMADQIKATKMQEALALQQDDDSVIAHVRQSTKQQVDLWQSMANEIERAEGRLVDNIVSGRRTLGESLVAVGSEIVAQEIQQDLRAVTTRLLLSREADGQKKALEQGGVLYHALVESQKTAQSVAGEQARTAAATAASQQRTAVTAAAATAARATAAATGPPMVMADAAKAYAGTFASVAQIPYVGWALAPGAAAAAFSQVSAFSGLASLAVGTFDVPHDMVAQIHAHEMVVPRSFADGIRSMTSGSTSAGAGGGGGDTHHHHYEINAIDASSFHDLLHEPESRDSLTSAIQARFARGGR